MCHGSDWRASKRALQRTKEPGDTGASLDEHVRSSFMTVGQLADGDKSNGEGRASELAGQGGRCPPTEDSRGHIGVKDHSAHAMSAWRVA